MFDVTASPLHATPADSESVARPALSLFIGADSCLRLERGESTILVRAVRCFPWSEPGRNISLRDDAGVEQHLVEDPAELDPGSRAALAHALGPAGFVLEIEAVESIVEDYEVRVWRTRTRHGARTFQTALDAWPWPAPAGGHFLQDIAGDLYRIPPLEQLDPSSRARLFAYVG
jgi:uncharacterized protein DUF1854